MPAPSFFSRIADRFWPKLALLAVSTFCALLVAEGVLRMAFGGPQSLEQYPLLAYSRVWDHMLHPNTRLAEESADPQHFPGPVVYQVNSLGCRDRREFATFPPANVRRIIVIGDSYVEGEGINQEETLGPVLERRLHAAYPAARFEVINCACASYSPILIYLRLKYQLLALRPEAVLVAVDLTDVFDDNHRYRPFAVFSRDGEPLRVDKFGWKGELKQRSALLYFAADALRPIRTRFSPAPRQAEPDPTAGEIFSCFRPPVTAAARSEISYTVSHVNRLIDLATASHVKIALTVNPHLEQFQPDETGVVWNRELECQIRDLCSRRGVPFYSPFDVMEQAFRTGQRLFFEDNIHHYSPIGERIWTGALSDFMVASLAPPNSPTK
jgi:hypothetical protein